MRKSNLNWKERMLVGLLSDLLCVIQVATGYLVVDIIFGYTLTWGTLLFGFIIITYLMRESLRRDVDG